jgi:ABC-type lipoprotein export system ATPase subunit
MSNYPQGSIWRKWDMHVHTPYSKLAAEGYVLEDGSDPWDKFCEKIEQSDVIVFGITDYFSVDNYFIFIEKFFKKYPDSEKVFFPNIEFRLEDKNKENDYVNIHVIFSNLVTKEDIQKFLDNVVLENINGDGTILKCNQTDLSKVGYDKALVKKESIQKSLKDNFGKKDVYLVCGVANGYGGIRPPQNEGRHTEYAKTIDEICPIFFGRASDKDFFIGDRYEGSVSKPVISGSDSHSLTHLDQWLGKRVIKKDKDGNDIIEKDVTWIKADPTFEGLKQIRFEPNDRIRIQENSPYSEKNKVYFGKLALIGSTNFIIPNFELPLNRELVALIGGRGTGKTALLDSFAFLNEEHVKHDQNEKKKIIEYYRDNENKSEPVPGFSLTTSITDKDGNATEVTKELSDHSNLELPFLYLGQEQLSGIATNDFELTRTVCQLIGIDINEIGQEALIAKARSILSDIANNQKLIDDIITRYTELGYSNKTDIEKWITDYLSKLTEQQKRLSSKETREILEDINKKTEQGLKLKDLGEKAEALQLGLRKVSTNDDIGRFNVDLQKIYTDVSPIILLNSDNQIATLTTLKDRIKTDMDTLRADILKQKQALIKQGIKEDVNSLLQASENLQKQISTVERDQQNYADAKAKAIQLHSERADILREVKSSLEMLRDAITSEFTNFEQSRTDSATDEKELFEGIIKGINVIGQIEFKEKVFVKELLNEYVDNRKIQNETELKKIIAGQNPDGTAKDITIDNLFTWIQSDLSAVKFNKGGLEGVTEFIFTKWDDFLGVKAVAKLNGKATEVLSIGQRGTLLLKVYLATSTAKQVFVIDQPEDNLDNSFIMNELVPLIRKAKKSRQIIMSTHNANLVVNADAEQVIVAQLDQEKGYLSGSIENLEINKNIRDILEGGEDAFRKRESKYLSSIN